MNFMFFFVAQSVYRLTTGCSVPERASFFYSPLRSDRFYDPPSAPPNRHRGALTLGIKRPGREADYSNFCQGQEYVDLYIHAFLYAFMV
jgi:hypothetical protein